MPSPEPVGPAGRCAYRARRSRRRHRAVATLVVGAGLAVTSMITLVGGHHGGPPALRPVAAPAVAPAAPTSVPGRTSTSRSLGPMPGARRPARKPARLLHVRPVAVSIPSVGIDSTLLDLRLNTDRTLQSPTDYARAGWYAAGSYPGDADGVPAIVAGHVDSWNGPAVFYPLSRVKVGQQIRVRRADDSVAVFDVYAARRYAKDAFPADAVYAPTARAELRVITCTGAFDRDRRSYLDNLVLFARLNLAASQSAP